MSGDTMSLKFPGGGQRTDDALGQKVHGEMMLESTLVICANIKTSPLTTTYVGPKPYADWAHSLCQLWAPVHARMII